MAPPSRVVLSCLHGGRRIPRAYAPLFEDARYVLSTHRGYDPGASAITRYFERSLGVRAHRATVSRLLVDLNRSTHHPDLHSARVRGLTVAERDRLLAEYYHPHREVTACEIAQHLADGATVIHLSIHTFTPRLRGIPRRGTVGLLYDPGVRAEREFCDAWEASLRATAPRLRVRRNYPYRGTADGLPTTFRQRFPAGYLGIELEVTQRVARRERPRRRLADLLATTFRDLISSS